MSPTPVIRCTCGSCNKLIDLEIPPESGRSETDPRLTFEPVSAHPLLGYEAVGPEGGGWCRVKDCNLSNHPCKRHENGVVCFCKAHWKTIRSDAGYMQILRREARDRGCTLCF